MRFYTVLSALFLLYGLVILGCGDEADDNNANVLDPQNGLEGQNSPIVNTLIPPDEIPVITIEKTREDAENIWWRLKADPAPIHGDLVVGLSFDYDYKIFIAIPKFEKNSVEMKYDKAEGEYSLRIMTAREMIIRILHNWGGSFDYEFGPRSTAISAIDLPAFQLDDGYVVPQGFQFSYYLLGEPSD